MQKQTTRNNPKLGNSENILPFHFWKLNACPQIHVTKKNAAFAKFSQKYLQKVDTKLRAKLEANTLFLYFTPIII